jgi:hypothetical protein
MANIGTSKGPQKKKVKCAMCKRTMEAPVEENPPYYCWKCEDKHFGPVS